MIPFFDLTRQYKSIQEELLSAEEEVFTNGLFVKGQQVKKFENDFANYIGAEYCISCGNGTDALELILKAWGIGPGDEVIVPAFTWISDAEAVVAVGAIPIFVDIEDIYFGLDPKKLNDKVSNKTKAIIPVHLFGHPCRIEEIKSAATKNNILLLEDVAQSHGSSINGRKSGTFGDAAIFSFYPTKNLGAYGDSGAVVTDDEMLASKIRLLADHGQPERDHHVLAGRNSRMDELQAAFLNVKLKYLDKWNQRRAEIAGEYSKEIDERFLIPKISPNAKHVFHQYVIRHSRRDEVRKNLENNNIGSAIHYPAPIPAILPFVEEGWEEKYPVAKEVSETILSLPVFPELNQGEIECIITSLNRL